MNIYSAFSTAKSGDLIPCAVTINQDGAHVLVAEGNLQFSPQHIVQGKFPIIVMAQFSGSPTWFEQGPDFGSGPLLRSPPKFHVSVSNSFFLGGGLSVTFSQVNGNDVFTFVPQSSGGAIYGVGDGLLGANGQALYTLTFGNLFTPPK